MQPTVTVSGGMESPVCSVFSANSVQFHSATNTSAAARDNERMRELSARNAASPAVSSMVQLWPFRYQSGLPSSHKAS